MRRTICPYLGLKDDPTTALQFPSSGNFCHHSQPIKPVKGTYQQKYCLTAEHTACPIYQSAQVMPLPASLAAPAAPSPGQGRRTLAMIGIPILLAAAAVMALSWNALGARLFQTRPVPDTGGSNTINANPYEDFFQSGGTSTPFAPALNNAAPPQPTIVNCPMPQGWITYTVNPTDSLFRLSVIYGVSVEQLQQVNCMGNKTVILPGQVIYVPYIPTDTPAAPNPILQPAQPNNNQAPQINPPQYQAQPTAGSSNNPGGKPRPGATNTTAPPTAANTAVPPTTAPPTLAPATPVPPSATAVPPTRPAPTQPPPTARPTRVRRPTQPPPTLAPATPVPTLAPTQPLPTLPLPTLPLPTLPLPTLPLPTIVPATPVPATPVPATAVPATAVPATAVPATPIPATSVPATAVPATAVPATDPPPTQPAPTSAPPTVVIDTLPPPTDIPPTDIPPTSAPVQTTVATP